jgi:hypothetical protein
MSAKSVVDLARTVEKHLKRSGARSPGVVTLARFLEVVYFASLKTEEGKPLQLRVALVDPKNQDPDRPPRPRADRWRIVELARRVPFTVPNVVKLSKAADPWSSCLAVYFDESSDFYVWGLIDQTVHFNRMLVRENEGGYAPPGLFQVFATGTADLTVYRHYSFVARLAQDNLSSHQNDVFWEGQISKKLSEGIKTYIDGVLRRFPVKDLTYEKDEWAASLARRWRGTLCRVLIGIQRYRHGGAVLLTRGTADLDVKYRISYSRLPEALVHLEVSTISETLAYRKIFEDYIDVDKDRVPVDLYLDEALFGNEAEDFRDEITGCVRFVSSLSCVDGLILMTPELSVRGFGVEIRSKKDIDVLYLSPRAKASMGAERAIDPNHYGTRHRSMMRYCMAHPKSVGFVISQDGEIRAMTRVGARLVMWENLQVLSFWDQDFRKELPRKSGKARSA